MLDVGGGREEEEEEKVVVYEWCFVDDHEIGCKDLEEEEEESLSFWGVWVCKLCGFVEMWEW